MSLEHRFNEKKKIDEYRVRYRWKDEYGKLKCSKTAWFPTPNEAEKNATSLKEAKEVDSSQKIKDKREAYIITILKNIYLPYLKEKAFRITTELSSTDMVEYRTIYAVIRNHIPEEVKYTKVKEISPRTFRVWLNYINDKDLSGATVARYSFYIMSFNSWLGNNGYYADNTLDYNIQIAIDKLKLKNKKVGARKDRYLLDAADLAKVVKYYREKGLGHFKNFYYYTLFFTLFYTGMRPEECTALQWKNVDLRPDERVIYIVNAISHQERECNAIARTKSGIYYTKNTDSARGIPIFDIIYQLLVDYRESYIFESGISLDNLGDCFVFPRQLKYDKFDFYMFDGPGYWLKEYKKCLKAVGLPNSDIQMLRHSCATFLIAPEPDGLGFSEDKVIDFFGHVNPTMLQTVYAKLQQKQKTTRMKILFNDYYSPTENKRDKDEYRAKERVLKSFTKGNQHQKDWVRRERIIGQISNAIAKGQEEYYYSKEDKDIISEVKDKFNITFKPLPLD